MKEWINSQLNPPPVNQTVVLYGIQYEFDEEPVLMLGHRSKYGMYYSNHEGEVYRVFYWTAIPTIPRKGKNHGISK